ncbi:MAG TPA: hypothetical protein VGW78_06700 [Candidatus Babeliales bacterium]|jgi:hypothetical protein|nr:hypothetical protein [Candidatus Babeliales bacterium]
MIYKSFIVPVLLSFGISTVYTPTQCTENQHNAWQMVKDEVRFFGNLMKEIPIPAITGFCATMAASAILTQSYGIANNQNAFTKLIVLGAAGLVAAYAYYLPHRIAKILIKVCNGNYSDVDFNSIAFLAALTTFAALHHAK